VLGLTLYGRGYCHLCDELYRALEPWRASGAIAVTVVDVDADALLEQRYGERVPVLCWEGGEICHYVLDSARLREVLALVG
jgi:hypothetical protein